MSKKFKKIFKKLNCQYGVGGVGLGRGERGEVGRKRMKRETSRKKRRIRRRKRRERRRKRRKRRRERSKRRGKEEDVKVKEEKMTRRKKIHRKGKIYSLKTFSPRTFLLTYVLYTPMYFSLVSTSLLNFT